MTFTKGQSVVATFKDGRKETGRVVYQRMAGPTYSEAEAVSVFLDSQRNRVGYCGTMFFAADVVPEDNRDAAVRRANEPQGVSLP